ncbi:MAG: plasmid maintenance protein CcdB [Hyphomicrobiales bacterium]|nr:MAG: plasmid maintenance protein CcdB [Hyphomicrobiales bacterium]
MARYDVYRDPRGTENLLVCIQADLFDQFETRMVIPLLPERPPMTPLKKLNPVFTIEERRYVLHTQLTLSVPASALRVRIANIETHRDEITAALDFLFQGF